MTARVVAALACLLTCCTVGRGACLTGVTAWQNTAVPPRTGHFTVEFDATPNEPGGNGIVTMSLGPGSNFDDFAVLIRFKGSGQIVVRNGNVYDFDVEVLYIAGSSHHVRAEINVPEHTYSVWVTPPSGDEIKIATDYDFRTTQNTVESLDNWGVWSGQGSLEVCNFAVTSVAPSMQALVTSAGLTLVNTELLWIRSHDPADTVDLVVGSSMDSLQASSELWLYFATSECLQWNEELFGCLASETQVALTAGVGYDLVGWSEAEDRREPDREMVPIVDGWSFHPADVTMDGSVDCEDLSLFLSGPYDWNLDGEATEADRLQLLDVLGASRADVDGDGIIDVADMTELLGNWGPCPPAGDCVTDIDCDGIVGIGDMLVLLNLWG